MVLWRLGRIDEARRELSALVGERAEFGLQASLVLGALEEQAGGPMPGRLEKVLEHYRRAWQLDPGNEVAVLSLAMALARRVRAEDLVESRLLIEDYLRVQPASIPALMLRYSF
jgi:chorismate mutase